MLFNHLGDFTIRIPQCFNFVFHLVRARDIVMLFVSNQSDGSKGYISTFHRDGGHLDHQMHCIVICELKQQQELCLVIGMLLRIFTNNRDEFAIASFRQSF